MVLGVYEFAYGVREAAPSFQWDAYPLGVVLVALAVFLMACFFLKRTDFSLVYRTPFPLMICGLATVSFTASLGAFLSDTLVSARLRPDVPRAHLPALRPVAPATGCRCSCCAACRS